MDLYLEIYTRSDPKFRVEAVDRFASLYANSEFLGLAYQYQMLAYRSRNDYDGLLRAGEKALSLMPRNLHTLVTLAAAIPNGVAGRADAGLLLARAESYARQGLEELKTFKVPQEIALADWQVQRNELESELHEALGHVAIKRGEHSTAIRELEAAVSSNPQPSGRQFLRLSSAYLSEKRFQEAQTAGQRAADLSNGEIRELALRQLRYIQEQKGTARELAPW